MKAITFSALVAVVCIFSLQANGQKLTVAQKEILALQDERSLGDGKLVSYLQSKDRDVRYRAAIALGNIQDTTTVGPLLPLLQDENVQVRAAAAFALGEIGTQTAEGALGAVLNTEQDMTVLARIFEALGKCGSDRALSAAVSFIPSARNIAIKRDQALCIARFAIRKISSERAVWLCYDLLKDNHAETRWAASYALWRLAPTDVLDLEISRRPEIIQNLIHDKNEDVRVNLATLLARTKSEEAPELLKLFCSAEMQSPDWKVQVQLARACAALAPRNAGLVDILLDFLHSNNDHVRIATLSALGGLTKDAMEKAPRKDKFLEDLKSLASMPSKAAPLVQGEAMVTFSRLFPDAFSADRINIAKGLRSNLLKSKYIEALSVQPSEENLRYVLDHLADDSVRIQMAAWDFLRAMLRPGSLRAARIADTTISSVPSILVKQMHTSLGRRDMAVTTLVANAFTDSAIVALCEQAGFRTEILSAFVESYGRLSSRAESEPMQAIQTAFVRLGDTAAIPALQTSLRDEDREVARGAARSLSLLTGKIAEPPSVDSSKTTKRVHDWKSLESLPAGQRITFRTTKGVFSIRLRKDLAPFTALTFYELVKKKFYDGLIFHRVVPDFVIQGGDPRGDGWGGPGFSIRSEWGLFNFVRGTVGLASSGKDTEGCQFFITHVPTPHLDGRYTIFATVSSGMEVVDAIQVGDRILSAEAR